MKYGIVSDIHGNIEALTEVMSACKDQGVEQFLCLGDIAGYGVNVRECIQLLKDNNTICVAGNHDWAVSGRLDYSYFTSDGKAAIDWQKQIIGFEYISFLAGLEPVYKNDELILSHACLNTPENFYYLTELDDGEGTFEEMDRPVCFVGHTHLPQIFIKSGSSSLYSSILEVEVDADCKYIVNVGSVGQPRDGNPMASYGIYDTVMEMVEVKRVQYDIASAQQKIIDAGLPESLAKRLAVGR